MDLARAWLFVAVAGVAACDGGAAMTIIDAAAIDAAGGADAAAPGPAVVYVGAGDNHVHAYALDEATLMLTPIGDASAGAGPSFLAFDPRARWLVAVNEGADAVESFAIAPTTGALTRVDGASSQGGGPAHVAVDATGAWVFVADYGGGAAAVLPIDASGHFGAATATVAPGANAHEVVLDATGANVYVPCLGDDRVARYGFDAITGQLTARPSTTTATGAGPRHLAIAPDGAHAWVINEPASSITTYAIGADGALTAQATVSSRAANATGTNTGAEIAVHPSGAWLYVSNRGDDTIGQFAIGAGGALTPVAQIPTGGQRPRHFSLTLDGRALLVANQTSGTIVGFHVDATTGALTSVGTIANVTSPQFVGALRLPR